MHGHRVIAREKGGPEKLIIERFVVNKPKDNQIVIKVKACGVNFIDTYHRSGLYPGHRLGLLGLEGSGIVILVGKNAKSKYCIGDKVCWMNTMGSYSTHIITSMKNPNITKIPQILFDKYGDEVFKYAASILSQALTAHYLCHDTYKVSKDDTVLVHAGAGGTGGILLQILKNICKPKCIITTVSNQTKKEIALENGADHVILYNKQCFYKKVMEITNNKKCNVVFDGVGKATADKSLKCCAVRGMMVYFGNASGAVPPVDPLTLCRQGSVMMIRPTLKDYCRTSQEKTDRMNDIFEWIGNGKLKIRIGAEYSLKDAMKAHKALEGRKTMGKIILLPESLNTFDSKL